MINIIQQRNCNKYRIVRIKSQIALPNHTLIIKSRHAVIMQYIPKVL
jgi:hypothetical protein